ncbi:MAG: flagellar M-ring protein FliF [Clostridiales bacterium]|nr:flagellar M-ring protein FliF [Clostridiales bacterium]
MDLKKLEETFKKFLDQIKEFWAKMTKKAKIIFFSVLGAVVVLAVVLVVVANRTNYVVLYPNLEQSEATAIVKELVERNVAYKETDGTIYIDSTKEDNIRMELANLGYPQTSLNYDFFTSNIGIMTTDYEKKVIETYQLNTRLGNIIKTMEPIKNAEVTISVSDSKGYAWEEAETDDTTASVKVTLYDGKELSSDQVSGIKQLVAKSVPKLSKDNVTIVDQTGKELNEDKGEATSVSLTEFRLQIEKQIAKEKAEKVEKLLKAAYGEDKVKVSANVEVNIDNAIKESVTYIPSGDDNTGVLSHSIDKAENKREINGEGGVVGTETNSEATSTTTYENVTDGSTIYSASEKDYEYLVSQVKEQVQKEAANISNVTVAIVMDWPTMSDDTKATIQLSAANTAGTTVEKVSVLNTEFYKEEVPQEENTDPFQGMLKWIIIAAAGALLIAIIVIVIIAVIKKSKKKKEEVALEDQMETIFGDDGSVISTGTTGNTVSIEAISTLRETQSTEQEQLQKEIQEFAGENPEIAAHLIRQWLRGEDS